jgi:hypothetical protein
MSNLNGYAFGILVEEESNITYVAAERLDIDGIVLKQFSGGFSENNVKYMDRKECMQGKNEIAKKSINLQS